MLLLLMLTALSRSGPAAEPPNIVFILADDLAWSDLGCYGHAVHRTPNIDRLAREGFRFTQAYAPAPICSASRAAILTGKTPARLHFEFVTKDAPGQQQLPVPLQSPPFTLDLPLEEVTLGEALTSAGYATGFFGKWHINQHYEGYLGWSPTYGPRAQGFSEGIGDFGSHPYAYRANPGLRDEPVTADEFPQDKLTDAAIEFVQRHQEERFFLYLSMYYVHDPIHTRCDWLIDAYSDRLPPETPAVRASYAAMVETLDHLVGRVLTAIDEAGEREETLVVLMSDNGGHPNYTSNAPLRGSKWNLYEGGIRVPLIVRWPGQIEAGSRCDAVVHGCDLFPTFCEVAGATLPAGPLDGISLWPLLGDAGGMDELSRTLIWHFPYYHPERGFAEAPAEIGIADFVTSQTRPHSAFRSGRWKLLLFYEDERVELYDLSADPGEQFDLSSDQPVVADRLRIQLVDALEQCGVRLPSTHRIVAMRRASLRNRRAA